jgi:autotransporter-associated beta strand protein
VHADILSSKRGFADVGANYSNLQATGAGWYYTWGTGVANPGNFDAKHYPMFWNAPSQGTIDNVKARNPEYVLGFNEPERPDQANMTVAQAIASWTTISNSFTGTSTKLVGPAVADTGGATGGQQWLANFMSQANANGLKVDAVAFHWYGVSNPNNPSGAASSFLSRVDSYYNSYGKPVFITEYAIHDWGGAYSDEAIIEANRQFLDIVIPGLESRSHVAGYSWYHWFSDAPLYSGNPITPTPMGYRYIGAVRSGTTEDIGGDNLGEHVAYLTGGTLTMTGAAGTVSYINALANTSTITGSLDWGLNSATNWVRVQSGATLRKSGANLVTFSGPVTNNGAIEISDGVLRLGATSSGSGVFNLTSTGGATGSTARLELTGNIAVSNPIIYAQRNDPGGSDGIRNISGTNLLRGPMTIVVGGNQTRLRSDAGQLILSGGISTNATTSRNLHLMGAGGGVIGGSISDNPSDANGKINLIKEGAGLWTLSAPNAYTGATTISQGTLRLDTAGASVANRWSFNGSLNDSAGGASATIVNVGANDVTLSSTHATLAGGARASSDYIALGANRLPNTHSPITIELWATPESVQNWSRIIDIGSSTTEDLFMSWTQGTNANSDRVGWRDSASDLVSDNTNQPYTLDTEYHIAMVLEPLGSSTVVTWYTAAAGSANLGAAKGTFVSTNTLASFIDNESNLGRSFYTADSTANASYNEVRFWTGALNAAMLEALHDAGPDANLGAINLGAPGSLPPNTALNITAAGATFNLNNLNQTLGSMTGVAGSNVALGSGALTVGMDGTSTTFAGNVSGMGSLTKVGGGELILSGNNTFGGGVTINGGRLIVNRFRNGALAINSGSARVAANPFANDPAGTSVVPAISIGPGASLDLTNNSMVIDYGGDVGALVDDTRARLLNGSITSNLADMTHGLGYGDNSVLGMTSFGGVGVDSSSLLIKFTYFGDANLDGQVDVNDLGALATNWQASGVWTSGDFSYDGTVDVNDLGLLATNWQAGVGAPLTPTDGHPWAFADAFASFGLMGATVPEPTALSVLALTGAALCRRRRFK